MRIILCILRIFFYLLFFNNNNFQNWLSCFFRVLRTDPSIWQFRELLRHPERRVRRRISLFCKARQCRVACHRQQWAKCECDAWTPLRSQSSQMSSRRQPCSRWPATDLSKHTWRATDSSTDQRISRGTWAPDERRGVLEKEFSH